MPFKFRCQKKAEIPAKHLSLYAVRDGGWQLDADGVADKSKLDEQRKRFEGIDPEEVRKLIANRFSMFLEICRQAFQI